MKRELWVQAMNELPDEWIEEAGMLLEEQPASRSRGRHRWLRIFAAACLAASLCGNVFAYGWIQNREEQIAQQKDLYLRYLTEAAQDLRADVFDAERFFAALDSTDDETVYIAVNRLAACYNDPVLRERAAEAVEPFMNSPSRMIADSAKRVSAVLREDFDAAGIVRLPDGGAVFTLYPGLDGGDAAVLWRIEDGVLSEWWSFEAPYRYITDLLISPDGKKLAVCLASGKSGFLVVIDFESDKVSGELINTVLADVRARNGMQPHVRADFETYSFAEQVHWTGQGTLAFDAALYFAPEGVTEVRPAEYDPGAGCLAVE